MIVNLLAMTQNPENVIAAAAKLCYSKSEITELMDNLTPETVEKFINRLESMGHESPFEHVSFTFGIEGISRACSHQLVRHRIASYSQQSQRYVDMNDFQYVTPPVIKTDTSLNDMYQTIMSDITKYYDIIKNELMEKYTSDGMNEKQAEKKANEDARYILPNACETKIVVTMNARSLFNFFKLRCCNRAQWEIRAVADTMLSLCKEVAPTIFKHAGPACMYGNCSEGPMSCGKPRRTGEFPM